MWLKKDFDYKDLKIALESKNWRKANEAIIDVFDHVWAFGLGMQSNFFK